MVVIALSGMPGCGSSTTGQLLAEKLGLKFFSIGKHQKSLGGSGGETKRSLEVWEMKKKEGLVDFEHTKDDMIRKLEKEGNVVIEAKLAIYMAKDADFKVWLKSDSETRAERYAKRDMITISEARKLLKKKENTERELWNKIYGFDYFDQEKMADIVVDTSDKTPEQIVDYIIAKMKATNC